ncbi:hypothetical protein DFH09DRAFT_1275811 [Mycena vulgaris]|nr:hypothetical protein DFH09DRAFT_1275811 [Mycena vulgaris]
MDLSHLVSQSTRVVARNASLCTRLVSLLSSGDFVTESAIFALPVVTESPDGAAAAVDAKMLDCVAGSLNPQTIGFTDGPISLSLIKSQRCAVELNSRFCLFNESSRWINWPSDIQRWIHDWATLVVIESSLFGLAEWLAPAQNGFFRLGLGFEWE